MNINKINYSPNFQAKFIKNEDMKNFCRQEISEGKADQLDYALNKLSQHHSNIALKLSKVENASLYKIENLYNNKSTLTGSLNTAVIEKISDVNSPIYRNLFSADEIPTPRQVERKYNSIADKYLISEAPNYELGHIIDSSI